MYKMYIFLCPMYDVQEWRQTNYLSTKNQLFAHKGADNRIDTLRADPPTVFGPIHIFLIMNHSNSSNETNFKIIHINHNSVPCLSKKFSMMPSRE